MFKKGKGNRDGIPTNDDQNDNLITDPIENAYSLNYYYASLFSFEPNNSQNYSAESGKPFTISINIIRKLLSTIRKKNSVGPDGIPGEILKLVGESMIPYLARLLDITMNNNAIPGDLDEGYIVSHLQTVRSIVSWKL